MSSPISSRWWTRTRRRAASLAGAIVVIIWIAAAPDPSQNKHSRPTARPARDLAPTWDLDNTMPWQQLQELEIDEEQLKLKDELFQRNAFNQYFSDRLSLHRPIPDTRPSKCRWVPYNDPLPTTTVIIIFHNEAHSTLLRTVMSVLDRSPPDLLDEILLIDDASPGDWIKEPLDKDVARLPKVRVIRLPERVGLIRAKVRGAKEAKGDVLTFLDSHCECNEGWLEPLLSRIQADRTIVASPVIEVIDQHTLEYASGGDGMDRGIFTWALTFSWQRPTPHQMKLRKSSAEPLRTPTIAGGLFSMDRKYFFEVGAYDLGMNVWGGENLEFSFRIWMCGGKLEIVPCSRVGHIFRDFSPYKFPGGVAETINRNLNRVAEVWLDEFKEAYYEFAPANRRYGTGDISERVELRNRLQCRSFKWYLDTVYPDAFPPLPDYYTASGILKSTSTGLCVDAIEDDVDKYDMAELAECDGNDQQQMYHTLQGQLRMEGTSGGRCLEPDGNFVSLNNCLSPLDEGHGQRWEVTPDVVRHVVTRMCLSVVDRKLDSEPDDADARRPHESLGLALTDCDEDDIGQQFHFTTHDED
eukprot:m.31365 g.31365  ORF g.31365 m.31365 type:complete len:582 (+) comp9726_c0_seq1:37-1782(+)